MYVPVVEFEGCNDELPRIMHMNAAHTAVTTPLPSGNLVANTVEKAALIVES